MAKLTTTSSFGANLTRFFRGFTQTLVAFGLTMGLVGCTSEPVSIAARFIRSAPTVVVNALMTQDQLGRVWFEAGEPAHAVLHFRDPLWRGIALEATGDTAGAVFAFSRIRTARGAFREGNALARLERLPAAVEAYERALSLDPDFSEAVFNLDWVRGLIEVDSKIYEDFGGTGGKLEADEVVFDDRAADALGEITIEEARAQGLSEEELREMWMRRVQTTPGDFLRLKFAYQAQVGEP